MDAAKQAACAAIDGRADVLKAISKDISEHPEENFEEVYAHQALTEFLEKQNFPVERSYVVKTGFRSTIGSREIGPHIAILCEYDALPEIGHACGHNLIAEAGLAAGIGVRAAMETARKPLGKLTILGTPAEEGGGGKIDMIDAGAFSDVDVAMMVHPAPFNMSAVRKLAIVTVIVKYYGRAAHASSYPWKGINALDAAVLCYQNVSTMRQQFKPAWRVHGVIRNGGAKPNIIPELTELEFYARTSSRAELEDLKGSLEKCFKGAATSTGCAVDIHWSGRPYLDIINNSVISDLFHVNAVKQGVDFENHGPAAFGNDAPAGSTDMGNVSYVVPSIHPMFYIGTDAVNHTREFTGAAADDKAQPYTLAVAKAMALTAIDIYFQPETLPKIKEEFDKTPK